MWEIRATNGMVRDFDQGRPRPGSVVMGRKNTEQKHPVKRGNLYSTRSELAQQNCLFP